MKLLPGIFCFVLLTAIFSFGESEGTNASFSFESASAPPDTLRIDSMVFADFFSPNGDGSNDLFIIQGVELYPENTFTVFNRWGQVVYDASPYNNEWDGTNNQSGIIGERELSDGVFFFELKSGTGYTAYGKITLKR